MSAGRKDGPQAVAGLDLEEVQRCAELLEAIVQDPALLAELPQELRKTLLIAAGRISRPESHQRRRLVKALRRARRRRVETDDRQARSSAGIRVAREAAVFVAPAPAPALQEAAPAAEPKRLLKPKACYVCKAEFTLLHHFYDALCP